MNDLSAIFSDADKAVQVLPTVINAVSKIQGDLTDKLKCGCAVPFCKTGSGKARGAAAWPAGCLIISLTELQQLQILAGRAD